MREQFFDVRWRGNNFLLHGTNLPTLNLKKYGVFETSTSKNLQMLKTLAGKPPQNEEVYFQIDLQGTQSCFCEKRPAGASGSKESPKNICFNHSQRLKIHVFFDVFRCRKNILKPKMFDCFEIPPH